MPENIAIIGLGYVGLPLAVHLARHFPVVGYDVKRVRVEALARGLDATGEVAAADLKACKAVFASPARLAPVRRFLSAASATSGSVPSGAVVPLRLVASTS